MAIFDFLKRKKEPEINSDDKMESLKIKPVISDFKKLNVPFTEENPVEHLAKDLIIYQKFASTGNESYKRIFEGLIKETKCVELFKKYSELPVIPVHEKSIVRDPLVGILTYGAPIIAAWGILFKKEYEGYLKKMKEMLQKSKDEELLEKLDGLEKIREGYSKILKEVKNL